MTYPVRLKRPGIATAALAERPAWLFGRDLELKKIRYGWDSARTTAFIHDVQLPVLFSVRTMTSAFQACLLQVVLEKAPAVVRYHV